MNFWFGFNESVDIPPIGIATSIVFGILSLIATWRVYTKAGQPGWAALIPLYNMYILYKIAWGNGWRFLWLFVPIANVVVAIMMLFKLAKSFGKGTGFGFGLLFLMPIFILILAFGDARYHGPAV